MRIELLEMGVFVYDNKLFKDPVRDTYIALLSYVYPVDKSFHHPS